jgi:glycolate oxidase FAD binding subunit
MAELVVANERDVVEAMCAARTARAPFEIVGGRSKRNLGRATNLADILNVRRVAGIVAYEPEELILTARPGTPIVDIAAALAAKGQRLGFDPPDWGPLLGATARSGTIGGAISVDASGPGRLRYGAVRDQLLGIRGVNGFGDAFKAGGKVVKNVTGFDIPKLVCGAFGTLCVLTEVTLRVFPKPSRSQTLAVRQLAPAAAFALLRKVWSSPLEATGLACTAGDTFIRLDGEQEPLAEKIALLRSLCGGLDLEQLDDGEAVFRGIADGSAFVTAPHDVWRVALAPSRAADVVEKTGSPLWVGDWAGGLIWLATNDHQGLREIVREAGGHAMLMRAAAQTRASLDVFENEEPVRAQLTRSVKAAFDPLGLFNPGRMWDGV